MNLEKFYDNNYKKLMLIPVVIFLISLFIIYSTYSNTGDIIKKDVSLEGGISATVYTDKLIDLNEVEESIKDRSPKSDVFARQLTEFGTGEAVGILIEASEIEESLLKSILESKVGISLTDDNYSVEQAGSSLGESFYRQMIIAMVLAFAFMAGVVLVTFRTFIPSIAVVSAAGFDILVTVGVLDLFGIRIGTAGIAAILLLIGYSVDTNMLLTTKALKRTEGSLFERMTDSARTGLTMTITTISAVTIGYIISSSYVLKEMFLIIFIGLFVDIFVTYLLNTGLLKWHIERKNEN